MKTFNYSLMTVAVLLVLSGCGGGGGSGGGGGGGGGADGNGGTQPPGNNPVVNDPNTTTLLPCTNTQTTLCSGGNIVRTDGTVAMTESGVQSYAISTSDLDEAVNKANGTTGTAFGLRPVEYPANSPQGGIAEIRIQKNSSDQISTSGLLLRNIGLSWDDVTQRPPIIEIFSDKQGRATLANNESRSVMFGPLPPSSDLNHYDWAVRKQPRTGTQANYANNVYFPRSEPIRCQDADPGAVEKCRSDFANYEAFQETQKPTYNPGNWATALPRNYGVQSANESNFRRLHEDGDLRAGDDVPVNGARRYINDGAGNSGFGVSYPGFKGYRAMNLYNYQYAHLAGWLTHDTVGIVEWSGDDYEHNKVRRGFVAFGDVTPSANVPTSGTATYYGALYGMYQAQNNPQNADQDADSIRGLVEINVNFANRTATVTVRDVITFNQSLAPVPGAAFTSTATLGQAGSNTANYFVGPAVTGTFNQGDVGARFFGPVTGGAPAELGGTFTLRNPGTGQAIVAGFIARKQ